MAFTRSVFNLVFKFSLIDHFINPLSYDDSLSLVLLLFQQVSRSEGESGAIERCQQHIITLTHLVPWQYASVLLEGFISMLNN